jgi:2-C-methyl-D-erythritol 2,4-cyclodiphosphate synthase
MKRQSMETDLRSGLGYDIHAFAWKRPFLLGGVRIPAPFGLMGHSDADVLLHAVCDALLGAAALGDIGKHFPNTSRKWKGASSVVLLRHVDQLLKRKGFMVVNIDATVLLEQPKIGRHTARMQRNIARVLGIPSGNVSVKATTNEGLGSLGRSEGCAAVAVALVRKG